MNATFTYENPLSVAPLHGVAAHEVAVGPVHAGVIEPGHFRFQCMGEDVYNLQIFLGYQHRSVEAHIVAANGHLPRQIALAETCAGDTSIAAATCFARIIERRDGLSVSRNDEALRLLLLELERIANHVGDLGALAGDVAFLPTSAFCGRIRGDFLNLTALVCGNRFGRNTVVPGGMRVSLTDEKRRQLSDRLPTLKYELDQALELMFGDSGACDRLDGTGVVSAELARSLGLVGVVLRASVDFKGDVLSRALVRRLEINEAYERILAVLDGSVKLPPPNVEESSANGLRTISACVNAWRGPLVHSATFDSDGQMTAYHIVDPSAHNWQGLAAALRGEQISNFPICNKSFNLSYCGTDR